MKVKCPKCSYKWDTNSKLDYVTCPNCQKKFEKALKDKQQEKNYKENNQD